MGKSASTPPAPDYKSAAEATAAGNRVNQITPYGSFTYNESGRDSQGNPIWTATTSLSPEQQKLLDIQNQTSLGLGQLQQQGLGYVENMLANPFDTSTLAQTGINPGETMQESILRRLQPQMQQQSDSFDAKMANQGIVPGTQAYENAKRAFDQQQNDLLTSAVIQGTQTGLAANQQGFNQLGYIRNEPINTLNAIRSGSQVTNPTFGQTAGGADILGATTAGYNAQLGAANAQNAANNSFTSGLMGLGGTLGGAYMMMPAASDIRTKENIKQIGALPSGLPVYEFEYKAEYKDQWGHGKQIGVMAQDVEKVIPEAVIEHPDGYKMVNYGALQ